MFDRVFNMLQKFFFNNFDIEVDSVFRPTQCSVKFVLLLREFIVNKREDI